MGEDRSTVHRPGRSQEPGGWSRVRGGWLALLKDVLQAAIWLLAFTGNNIEWRSRKMRLRRDGSIVPEFGELTGDHGGNRDGTAH